MVANIETLQAQAGSKNALIVQWKEFIDNRWLLGAVDVVNEETAMYERSDLDAVINTNNEKYSRLALADVIESMPADDVAEFVVGLVEAFASNLMWADGQIDEYRRRAESAETKLATIDDILNG